MDYNYIPEQQWLLDPFKPRGGTQPEDGIPNAGVPQPYKGYPSYDAWLAAQGGGGDGPGQLPLGLTYNPNAVAKGSAASVNTPFRTYTSSLTAPRGPEIVMENLQKFKDQDLIDKARKYNPGKYDKFTDREMFDLGITVGNYPLDNPSYETSVIRGQPRASAFTADGSNTVKTLKDEDEKSWFSSLFAPKVQGTFGTRLKAQYETGQKLPSWIAAIAGAQSAFNKDSRNYNPNWEEQLNYLEMGDKIGIDQGSGLRKYTDKSVLAGQNVFSGFGSNDYEEQLQKKLDWYEQRAKVGKRFSDKKRQDAIDEMKAWNNSPDNPKNKPTDGDGILDGGNEPPVGGYPGSEEEWGNLNDPNNPLGPEPDPNNYGFDNSGNFTGEGWGPDQGEESADSGHASDPPTDDWSEYTFARGGRVGLNYGGLARPFFYGGLARLL